VSCVSCVLCVVCVCVCVCAVCVLTWHIDRSVQIQASAVGQLSREKEAADEEEKGGPNWRVRLSFVLCRLSASRCVSCVMLVRVCGACVSCRAYTRQLLLIDTNAGLRQHRPPPPRRSRSSCWPRTRRTDTPTGR
jgi:hypothetical protein